MITIELNIKDVASMNNEELVSLKTLLVKKQQYSDAALINEYIKHRNGIDKLNMDNK